MEHNGMSSTKSDGFSSSVTCCAMSIGKYLNIYGETFNAACL
jgi:hypothetical protein